MRSARPGHGGDSRFRHSLRARNHSGDAHPGFQGDTPTLRHLAATVFSTEELAFCCYRQVETFRNAVGSVQVRWIQHRYSDFPVAGSSKRGRSPGSPISRGKAARRFASALNTRRRRPPLPAAVPCGGARVASRSAPLGWPGSSAGCSPAFCRRRFSFEQVAQRFRRGSIFFRQGLSARPAHLFIGAAEPPFSLRALGRSPGDDGWRVGESPETA